MLIEENKVKQIITISTTNYLLNTQRLLVSLNKTNKDFCLTIFCDAYENFRHLENIGNCKVRELRSIKELGVKRAKFEAYLRALEKGNFLYLDSDIIVLDDLSCLFEGKRIKACPDDLSECSFVTNKQYPWAMDPSLRNNIYINSGIFYAPQGRASFFKQIYEHSLNPDTWSRYIIENKLYDNHFICAFLNIAREEIEPIDGELYNWQGLRKRWTLMVTREGNSLVNKGNKKKLRVIHFAGVGNIDEFLMDLPIDISSLIMSHAVDPNFLFSENKLFPYIAGLSGYFLKPPEDNFAMRAFEILLKEVKHISDSGFGKKYADLDSYLANKEQVVSVAYAKPNGPYLWNGLKCGGAYLESQEYVYLREIILRYGIKSVIEIGAGETSILFKQMDVNALSIEAFDGPWLARARQHGCNVAHITFSSDELVFDNRKIEDALSSFSRSVDMIFIDSPPGTRSRSKILTQLLGLVDARFALFHDIFRDSINIFSYQFLHNLRIVECFDTARGMALFRVDAPKTVPIGTLSKYKRDTVISSPDYTMDLGIIPDSLEIKRTYYVKVALRNTSKDIYSSKYDKPVFISYHWFGEAGDTIIFDGKRTRLPFDIHPGGVASIEIEIITPDYPGRYLLEIDLVQELVCWFKNRNSSLGKKIMLNIV